MTDQERTAVEIIQPQARTALGSWGSRKEIAELADRFRRALKISLPAGESRWLSVSESLYLAQASLLHGLDPLAGEIVPLEMRGKFCLHFPAAAWMKGGRQQLAEEAKGQSANFWPEFDPIQDEARRALYGVPAGALAFECRLYDTLSCRSYTDLVKELLPKMPWEKVLEVAGKERPCVRGIGWMTAEDMKAMARDRRDNAYSPAEVAQKRAYKQALKKRFGLSIPETESDGMLPDEFTGPMAGSRMGSAVIEHQAHAPLEDEIMQDTGAPYPSNAEADAAILAAEQDKRARAKAAINQAPF